MILTVEFIDTLSKKSVYKLSAEVKKDTERARCGLLSVAYKVAARQGINLADRFVSHRFA